MRGFLGPYLISDRNADRKTAERIIRIFWIAASLGLLTGLLEAGANGLLSVVPDAFGWKNDLLPNILWIDPLFNGLLFCVAALPMALIAWRSRTNLAEFLTFSLLSLLVFFGPLAALGKLSMLAEVLLTLGLTVQMARMAARRKYFSTAALRTSLMFLVGAAVLVNLGGALSTAGSRLLAGQGGVCEGKPLNVLLIVVDTLRADHVSAYGYHRKTTPNMDLAASQGTLFENAYSAASWTLPAHASIFTGTTPGTHGAGARPLGPEYPTLAGQLTQSGYQTAGFSANLYFVNSKSGLTQGFSHFDGYFSNIPDMVVRTYYGKALFSLLPSLGYFDIVGRKRAGAVDEEVIDWADEHADRPFFAFINYFDVHDPYVPPDPYQSQYTEHPTRGGRINSELNPRDFVGGKRLTREEIQNEIDGYDGSISYVDAQIGSLIQRLSTRGLLDHTLLVITSDHGEAFGEHGLFGHGQNVYRHLVHVPLIFRLPGLIPPGRRIRAPVSQLDLPATILDVLGLDKSRFPGTSLAGCWSGNEAAWRERSVVVESLPGIVPDPDLPLGRRGGMVSFLSADAQVIYNEDGKLELYRFGQDPEERVNLANSPSGRELILQISSNTARPIPDRMWQQFGIPERLRPKSPASRNQVEGTCEPASSANHLPQNHRRAT